MSAFDAGFFYGAGAVMLLALAVWLACSMLDNKRRQPRVSYDRYVDGSVEHLHLFPTVEHRSACQRCRGQALEDELEQEYLDVEDTNNTPKG